MKYHTFGSTDLQVSEIGFGSSRIGGVFADRSSSSKEALAVLRKALDSGITFYDTADMYAQGESESLIGTAFRGNRSKVVLATKGGFCLPARRDLIKKLKPLARPLIRALGLKRARLPSGISGALSQDFSPAYLAKALEASLRRLKTDYVDLYQLHSPGISFMQSGAFGDSLLALEKLKQQGKLRYYGIATETPDEAPWCVDAPGIASIQVAFGLLNPEAMEQGTLAAARARGLAIIARSCLGGGLLKDDLDDARLAAAGEQRQQILAIRSFSQGRGRAVPALALQFCTGDPAVSVTLLGIRVERHLLDGLRHLAERPLDDAERAALLRLVETRAGAVLIPRAVPSAS